MANQETALLCVTGGKTESARGEMCIRKKNHAEESKPLPPQETSQKKMLSREICWSDEKYQSLIEELNLDLSPETSLELRHMFQLFDKNEDGAISTKEMVTVLRSFGHEADEESVISIMEIFDEDGDGEIEFPEFLKVASQMMAERETEGELVEIFRVLDQDGDGYISKTDMREVVVRLGMSLSAAEMDEMFEEADKDGDCMVNYEGDGVIEFPEFMHAVSNMMGEADSEEELIEIFRVLDQDGDGYISKGDLREVIIRLGIDLSSQDLEEMFEEADKDGDCMVNFEESLLKMGRTLLNIAIMIIWLPQLETRRNRDPYPGQGWSFREAVIRAQCEATCLSRYGIEPSVDPGWLEVYDVYVPLTCPETDGPCTQCLNPCFFIFGTRDKCYSHCATRHCTQSCDKIHELLAREQTLHEVMHSEFSMKLTRPVVTCQSVSFYGGSEVSGTGKGAEVYIRWEVLEDSLSPALIPLAFILEISAEHEGGYTNWVPFSGTHAWVPVSANWSTPYYFRVTPVLKDGVAGRSQTSELITTLSMRPDLQPPTDLKVIKQTVKDGQLYVTFEWIPSPDVMSCHYELILLPTGLENVITSKTASIAYVPQPRYQYGPLPYDTEYVARISTCSVAQRCTSQTTAVTFTTISCLQANNFSYFLCEPEMPLDFHVAQIDGYPVSVNETWRDCFVSLKIAWSPPPHASSTNVIRAYRLSVVKIPDSQFTETFEPHEINMELPSNVSSYVLGDLHIESEYIVRLMAVSFGGLSPPDSIYVNTTVSKGKCSSSSVILSPVNAQLENYPSQLGVILAPTICIFITVLLVIIAVGYYRRGVQRRYAAVSTRNQMAGNPLYDSFHRGNSVNSKGSTRNSGDIYEVDFADLELDKTLGQGAFGKVVKGSLNVIPKVMKGSKNQSPLTVAVKMVKDFPNPSDCECLLQEINLMKTLGRHPNVVSLVACVTKPPNLALIMDYCSHGDLKVYLRKLRAKYAPLLGCQTGYSGMTITSNKKCISIQSSMASLVDPIPSTHTAKRASSLGCKSIRSDAYFGVKETTGNIATDSEDEDEECALSPTQLLSFARQIAVGMEYLSQKKFIHRDLAARNVLVCDDGLLKISDFGLTRDIYEHNVYHKQTDGKLPIKWMSIEAIFDQVYTTKSDVWSFGITLWEIVTLGGTPYPGISSGDIYRKLKEGYRMDRPDNCSSELYEIMRSCWRTIPEERPDFTDLRSTFEKMIEEDQDNSYLSLEVVADNVTDNSSTPNSDRPTCTIQAEGDILTNTVTDISTSRELQNAYGKCKNNMKSSQDVVYHEKSESVRGYSEHLLPGAIENSERILPLSDFPQGKARVQNLYTYVDSLSKQGLNELPGLGLGLGFLAPLKFETRCKSSQHLDQARKSSAPVNLTLGLKFGRHFSAENLENALNESKSRNGVPRELEEVATVKVCLSKTTREFLKYWVPERTTVKDSECLSENESLNFTRCHRDSYDVENRL